jgi:NDP-sugar pyrophosphorylase family protein
MEQGTTEFLFLLHHEADKIVGFLEEKKLDLLKTCQIQILVESEPMGTGGAIANAIKELELKENFLVANSDTWLGTGIREVSKAVSPAIAVVSCADASRYGNVDADERGHVLSFAEKNCNGDPGSINAGLYHLSPELFGKWDGEPFSLERDLLPNLVQSHKLTAVRLATEFIDIGIPKDYYRFCDWIRSGRETFL